MPTRSQPETFTTILNPGSASSVAVNLKRQKYSQLVADFEFVPVVIEMSGIIGFVYILFQVLCISTHVLLLYIELV